MANVSQSTLHSIINTMTALSAEKSVDLPATSKLYGLSTNQMPPPELALGAPLRQSINEHTQVALTVPEEFNVQENVRPPISAITALSIPQATNTQLTIPKKLEEFTLFPSLPIELRLKIVRTAHPSLARVIHIRYVATTCRSDFFVNEGWRTSHISVKPTSIPTLLCINQQLRNEYLRFYPAPFASNNLTPVNLNPHLHDERKERFATALRINFRLDTIYLDGCDFTTQYIAERPLHIIFTSLFGATGEKNVREQIRYLAVDSNTAKSIQEKDTDPRGSMALTGHSYRALHEYGHLKEFSIVVGDLEKGYKLFGLREIEATNKNDLRRWFTGRLTKIEGCEDSEVKIVALHAKYVKHKLLMPHILKGNIEEALKAGRLSHYRTGRLWTI